MKALYEFAAEVQAFLEQQNWQFCFIGGVAVQRWSEARVTQDVDLTLLTGFGNEENYVDRLLSRFEPRIADARNFALQRRVLLLCSRDKNIGLDVALGAFPFEKSAVERAVNFQFLPNVRLRICTAEDLIVFKVFAGRAVDWRDVEMTIARQGEARLDWNYIRAQLQPLLELKGQLEVLDDLQKLRSKIREDR
ncbi:MAG: hypothetical protein L0Y58_15500 [Verrucomicrobia subdivision 3 bacterium]|nr:hypothetical protein [Limisphaerales bacterium]